MLPDVFDTRIRLDFEIYLTITTPRKGKEKKQNKYLKQPGLISLPIYASAHSCFHANYGTASDNSLAANVFSSSFPSLIIIIGRPTLIFFSKATSQKIHSASFSHTSAL